MMSIYIKIAIIKINKTLSAKKKKIQKFKINNLLKKT